MSGVKWTSTLSAYLHGGMVRTSKGNSAKEPTDVIRLQAGRMIFQKEHATLESQSGYLEWVWDYTMVLEIERQTV
jgi:hypothetical protein